MVSLEKHHIFIMVKRCVIQFCSNSNKTGHIMHKFPKDANLRWQWVKFVRVKRGDFVEPTEHSVICNIHFSPDCYEKSFMVEMGLKKQSSLLSGAVPTIQSPAATNSCDTRKRPIQNEGSEEPEVLTMPIKGLEEVELFKSLRLIE